MAAPNLSLTIEPLIGGKLQLLHMAPNIGGGAETGQCNLYMFVKNQGTAKVRLTKIAYTTASASKVFTVDIPLNATAGAWWAQPEDFLIALPLGGTLRLSISAAEFPDAFIQDIPMEPHFSPTNGYRFWGAVRDLRPGEFWQIHGTGHAQAPPQMFAYDVGVAVRDAALSGEYNTLLPGTDGTKNEHCRIWGKPIYAIADGVVTDFRYCFPDNPAPGEPPAHIRRFWVSVAEGGYGQDGNGNFFTVAGNGETVLYAHMRFGSLNPKLLQKGAAVKKGDFLGLAGNSGSSSAPHLHIHANRENQGPTYWVDAPRPMTFRNARAHEWKSYNGDPAAAAWVTLNNRGLPPGNCAIWPSDEKAVELIQTTLADFAVSASGQVWGVLKGGNTIRTTTDKLHARGVYLGVNPGGAAKQVAIAGEKPYLIGMDGRVWEGKPEGWFPVPNSPICSRIASSPANNSIWVIDESGRIRNLIATIWTEHPGGGIGKDVCVSKGIVHIIGSDNRVWKSAGAAGWQPLAGDGQGLRIAADAASGKLWIIGMDSRIYFYDGQIWKEHQAPGGMGKELALYGDVPYVIGTDDGLWKSDLAFGWLKLNLVAPKTG